MVRKRRSNTKSVPMSEARRDLPKLVDSVARSGRPAIITRRGEPIVKVVPIDEDQWQDSTPLRGQPIALSRDFDAPLDELWEALDS